MNHQKIAAVFSLPLLSILLLSACQNPTFADYVPPSLRTAKVINQPVQRNQSTQQVQQEPPAIVSTKSNNETTQPAQTAKPNVVRSIPKPQPRGSLKPLECPQIDTPIAYEGKNYVVSKGHVYELTGGKRELRDTLYDGDFVTKNYKTDGENVFRNVAETGQNYAVCRDFQEGFENANRVQDLIGPDRNWSSMTLLSPAAPTIEDYVKLRQQIIDHNAPFKDNSISLSTEQAHSGKQSLKLYAVKPSRKLDITKTTLDNELLFLQRHDNVTLSGWFYIAEGTPIGLLDIECNYINKGPGMRLLLSEELEPRIELKWADKPTYRARPGTQSRLPRNQWFKVSLHLYLSEKSDGLVQLSVNDQLVIDAKGQTLPVADAVYNRLQMGITSNPKNTTTVLYADDLRMQSVK